MWFADVVAWFGRGSTWTGADGVLSRLGQHVLLTVVALVICAAIALPVSVWLGHIGRGGALAVNISNIGRAFPTFAIIVLLAIGPLVGRPITATTVALVLFGLPPIVTNTYVGMREVDRDAVEAARGMGMSGTQVLRQVELPLALPLILTGLRISAVQIVATATIAAIVAGPGLGRIITAGFQTLDQAAVVGGAIVVALLALLVEVAMGVLERVLDPVRRARRRPVPTPTTAASLPVSA